MCFCAIPSIWDRVPQGPSYLVLRISKGTLLDGQRKFSASSLQALSCSTHLKSSWICGYASLWLQATDTGIARQPCFGLCPATCCRRNLSPQSRAWTEGWWDLFPSRQLSKGLRVIFPSCPSHSFALCSVHLNGTWWCRAPFLVILGQVYLSSFLFWSSCCQFFTAHFRHRAPDMTLCTPDCHSAVETSSC